MLKHPPLQNTDSQISKCLKDTFTSCNVFKDITGMLSVCSLKTFPSLNLNLNLFSLSPIM